MANTLSFEQLTFGDIIFISDLSDIGGKLTNRKQKKRYVSINDKSVKPTHVAIATGELNYIFHAVTKGVVFSTVIEYAKNISSKKIEIYVFRNKALKKQLQTKLVLQQEIIEFMYSHFGNKYNWSVIFSGKEKPNAKFCSELAATILLKFNFLNTDKPAEEILPVDLLESFTDSVDWSLINIDYAALYDKQTIERIFNEYIEASTHDIQIESLKNLKQVQLMQAESFLKAEALITHYLNEKFMFEKDSKKTKQSFKEITELINQRKNKKE